MNKQYITTGDIGYMNTEGYLFLKGRVDDMIISGGVNVYPKDIELVLLEHPYIQSVAVIGIKNELYGKRLYAFTST